MSIQMNAQINNESINEGYLQDVIIPDINWYTSLSAQKALTPRCPYANVNRCPRYYESLALLGDLRIATKLDPSEEKRLKEKWEKSELSPKVKEHCSSISWSDNKINNYSNYCPEVAYDIFGLFASELHRYADEIDRDYAHEQISAQDALGNDWRWQWAYIKPLHYSECPFYSLLYPTPPAQKENKSGIENYIEAKLGIWGFKIDLIKIFKGLFLRKRR